MPKPDPAMMEELLSIIRINSKKTSLKVKQIKNISIPIPKRYIDMWGIDVETITDIKIEQEGGFYELKIAYED